MSGVNFKEAHTQNKGEETQEVTQYLAYEREREAKARLAATREIKAHQQGEAFLKYVVEGEQEKAEALLQGNGSLLLYKGTVTDLSQRVFTHITGFQYALWALDWHMWQMLLKYMNKETAATQLVALEKEETAYGKHFDLLPLMEALGTYVKYYDVWSSSKLTQHWCSVVGNQQRLLPVHVVNEYCHPRRGFYPCPRFDELELRRSRRCGQGEWFSYECNGGRLGETFAMKRSTGGVISGVRAVTSCDVTYIAYDLQALQSLWAMRQQQLEALKMELQYFINVKALLNNHFPSVLSSAVLGYLG